MSERATRESTIEAGFPEVGAETRSRGRTIGESDLIAFAALTGDWHPQHCDAEWAAQSRFGARVAHGMLVLSYAVGLVDFDPQQVVALRGLDSVTLKRPVEIGDTIRLASRVERVRDLDGEQALVRFAWRITNQRDELVARATVEVLWKRAKPAAAPEPDAAPAADAFEALYGDTVLL